MTTEKLIAAIAVLSAVTFFTRAFPFLLFGGNRRPPRAVLYLGGVLPPAIIALLIVYCLRTIQPFAWPHGLPELICVGVVAGLHLWKRNALLSIFAGTILYMVLVQRVF